MKESPNLKPLHHHHSLLLSLIHSLHMATCLPFRSIPFKPNTTSSSSRPAKITCSSVTAQSRLAKQDLLALIADQDRGLKTQTDPTKRASIIKAIDALADLGNGTVTTGGDLSATWRLLWTTEKEQLFIIQNASVFGTRAGDVLQVIDVDRKVLNNVITFPPDGVFFVRSTIEVASPQRVNFRFTSAVLRGKSWEFPLPPFGQGWGCFIFLSLF
ncbi:probable plastid-lipid-associated protein 11, chloroplastic isoform X3 [Rosa rugosa]|uniref:probable plastid-lipid-associated protein 11, chloroplastic isoform X3 n=1 Tax=Rosa rugosa TaxID=74645 RepID=UPI002B4137EA|nr:probable plastid-lipid-associated protein 11, chloroplastic isoform X3 [Rosa rugosa]